MGRYTLAYFNLEKVTYDINKNAIKAGQNIARYLESRYVTKSWISNTSSHTKENLIYNGYCTKEDLQNEYIKYGIMTQTAFLRTMGALNLSPNDYLVTEKEVISYYKKEKDTKEIIKNSANESHDILNKLDELIVTINKLGNIEMQNMELLRDIKKGLNNE